ncbi:serpin family protein [Endozoicomonas sp. ALC020]|uniref:serpin family protein n=1 Tax=unclassified Endozoicomonas TaxID=2644528 RepID=UPI003BB19766
MHSFTPTGTIRTSSQAMQWQPSNMPATSFEITSQASDIVKKLINKVSIGILCTQDAKDHKSKVISSVSLAPVLGMLLLCMDDKAKKALILEIPEESLTDELETEIHKKLGEFSKDHPYGSHPDQLISCANFIASAFCVRFEQFEKILSECYLTQKLEGAFWDVADVTEAFVKDKTKGKIEKLFDGLNEVKAVIGNVIDCRAVWEDSFSPDETAAGRFLCANGTCIDNVKMMSKTETVQCASNRRFRAIAKEFQSVNGEDLKLVAIKPHNKSATAIDKLDSDTINELTEQLNHRQAEYTLTLPKINMDSCDTQLLKKICKVFGTDIVAGDLTKLGISADDNLEMLQKIIFSVDEKGASCAMATVAQIQTRCEKPRFDFDCPGYIAILDKKGNRLIELVIKDGSFLECVGDPIISTDGESGSNNLASFNSFYISDSEDDSFYSEDDSFYSEDDQEPVHRSKIDLPTKIKLVEKDLSAITRLSFDPLETIDVSAFIKDCYNPDGKLDIKSAKADNHRLNMTTSSFDDAKDIKKRILKCIGEGYSCYVNIHERATPIEVSVLINPWKKMIDQITSGFISSYISDSEDDSSYSKDDPEPVDRSEIDLSKKTKLVKKDLSAITRLSFDPLETVDVSTFIKDYYNPDGKLDIKSAKADNRRLKITTSSFDNAKDIRERILESIGKEYIDSVKIYERAKPIQVDVLTNPWKKMIDKITSGPTDSYISDSNDNPIITTAEKKSSDNLETLNDYDMPDSKVYTSDNQFTIEKDVTDLTSMDRISTLIQHHYNPNSEFDVRIDVADHMQLTLNMSSKDEVIELRERILKSIGDEHSKFVRILGQNSPFELEVSFEAWEALRNKLTSNQS